MNHIISKVNSKSISKSSKFSQDLRRDLTKLCKELNVDKSVVIFKGLEICKSNLN